jgi:hypothetical protein
MKRRLTRLPEELGGLPRDSWARCLPAVSDFRLRNLKTVDIRLSERLRQLERDWLIGQLVKKRGVVAALHDSADSRRVIVDYDADMVSPAMLVDFLHDCGLPAKLTARASLARIAAQSADLAHAKPR